MSGLTGVAVGQSAAPWTGVDRMLVAGFLMLAFLLAGPVLIIPRHIPISYNEGWNAYLALRAVMPGNGPLYPPAGGMVLNNYPPVSFWIVGLLGRFVFGDMIVAGRVVSLLSLLGCGALVGLCVRRLGGGQRASLAAGLLLLLLGSYFYHDYVAMDDPQWLAQMLALAGLATLLRKPARPAGSVILAALLMLTSGFVKHNVVALPIAVTLWLGWSDRRAALLFVGTAVIGLCAGLGLCEAVYGHAAFTSVIEHKRVIEYRRLKNALPKLSFLLPLLIMAGTLLPRLRHRDPAAVLAVLFIVIAFVTGLLERAGEGVYHNAHFETLAAVCMGVGLALSPVISGRRKGRATAWLGFAVLPLLITTPWYLPRLWSDIHDGAAREAGFRPIIARIAATDGTVGCEMLSICYWAGKPFTVDLFNYTQSLQTGNASTAPFAALVQSRRFAIFQYVANSPIHHDTARQMGWDPLLELFNGIYYPIENGPENIVLLAPRHFALANAP